MKTENTPQAICTDLRVYLVSFQYHTTRGKFIFSTASQLMQILKDKEGDGRGIESLKTFDPSKDKFVRISKADFLRFNSWETEAMEYFKNHYFFKK